MSLNINLYYVSLEIVLSVIAYTQHNVIIMPIKVHTGRDVFEQKYTLRERNMFYFRLLKCIQESF